MNVESARSFAAVATVVFAVVALAHLVRVVTGTAVAVGAWDVPAALSWIGVALAGTLSAWAFSVARSA